MCEPASLLLLADEANIDRPALRRRPPPATEAALLERADALVGHQTGDLARAMGWPVPPDLRRNKGWMGELIEAALGASAGSASEPDFPELGIECKTLPLDARGHPRESTWVCTAPVGDLNPGPWRGSVVQRRLARVLFVPLLGAGPPGERRVLPPLLWTPDPDEEATLKADWEGLVEALAEGETWRWTAHAGEALQLRPKAASSRHRIWVTDPSGEWGQAVPLGFYLRARFLRRVLAREGGTVLGGSQWGAPG